jgi:hypothetical protein
VTISHKISALYTVNKILIRRITIKELNSRLVYLADHKTVGFYGTENIFDIFISIFLGQVRKHRGAGVSQSIQRLSYDRGSIPGRGNYGIFSRHRVRPALGPTQPPTQLVLRALTLGVKHHSPPLPQYVFMAWRLIKQDTHLGVVLS